MPDLPSIHTLLEALRCAGESAGFSVESFGQVNHYPLLGMTRAATPAETDSRHIYLSAGIHGDEPAGPHALLELLQTGALPPTNHYYLCPLLNPVGMAAAIRENAQSIDLNRDYRALASTEIKSHAQWINDRIPALDYAIHLHEDWESEGFYLYELNFTDSPGFADQILAASSPHIAMETATVIDGRRALNGVIRPDTLPQLDEGDPESIYLQKRYGGVNYTLETPSAADFRRRVEALKAAVQTAL